MKPRDLESISWWEKKCHEISRQFIPFMGATIEKLTWTRDPPQNSSCVQRKEQERKRPTGKKAIRKGAWVEINEGKDAKKTVRRALSLEGDGVQTGKGV